MEYKFTVTGQNSRLLLIFAGWGMDYRPLEALRCPGYDIAVVWDYRMLSLPVEPFAGYDEVVVAGWSMGVWGAAKWLPSSGLPVTLTLAINGTMSPVSDTCGIPEAIYAGTLDGLSERTLLKFYRRMCGSAQAMQQFSATLPQRPIAELAEELQAIRSEGQASPGMRWDKAVISTNDAIFPPANMHNAWDSLCETVEMDGPHLPDWQTVIDRFLINKPLVASKFRNASDYDSKADVQRRIAGHLWQLWQKHAITRPVKLIEVGCGSGMLTRLYWPKLDITEAALWDLVPASDLPVPVRECDAETAIMSVQDASIDVVASASAVQWFNSLPKFLSETARVLRTGGLAVISTYGDKTFRELTAAGAPGLPYLSMEALRNAVPDNMEILELHDGIITKVFPSATDVLRHISATGVNAVASHTGAGRMRSIMAAYPLMPNGMAPLTYNPVYIILRKV